MNKRMTRTLAAVLTVLMALSLFVPAMAAKPILGEETVEAAPAAATAGKLLSVGGTVTQERPAVDDGAAASLLALEGKASFSSKTLPNDYFTFTGNAVNNKGTVSYNGTTYTWCLKMESETKVEFTAVSAGRLTLVFAEKSNKSACKVDDTSYASDANGLVTVDLQPGKHTITKGNSTNLFYLSFGSVCEHSVASWTTTKAADCIHDGTRSGTCSKCNETVTEIISATGVHTWSTTDFVTVTEPTCEGAGSKVAKCTVEDCTATDTANPETVPATGHAYDPGKTICKNCGIDKITGQAHTNHTWGGWSVTTPAKCNETGEQSHTCADCGKVETEVIAKIAHDTNGTNGTCSMCGTSEADRKGSMRKEGGDLETAYIEWTIAPGDTRYEVFVGAFANGNVATWTKLDDKLVREYLGGYMRADALGLKAGQYKMKVVPYQGNTAGEEMISKVLTVKAHERTGFGFVNGTSSGAYNEDGTLKDGARVIYITTSAELEALLNSSSIWQGSTNSGKNKEPTTCIRIIGSVQASDVLGFQDWSTGLTVEGVGNDATLTGGGVFVKGSSNVEIRNLAVFHVHKSGKNDLIAVEQTNNHIWVHNCDLYYGFSGGGDQAKGDGSLDVKDAENCTFSYNHFWDSGKCSLLGNGSTENWITYHHNWFDHSDSRHPRTRSGNVHIYNNYYDGNSKYGVGCTSGSGSGKTSIFVEGNYFRNTKYPILNSKQASDSNGKGGTNTFSGDEPGMIKAYNNVMVGTKNFVPQTVDPDSFDAYVVSRRDETIPSSVKAGSATYSNFDTDASVDMGVTAEQIEDPADAVVTVTTWAGRVEGGNLHWDFDDSVEDENDKVIEALDNKLTAYKSSVKSIGGTVTQTITGAPAPHVHTPSDLWKITQAPGCNPSTKAVVDGVETQYCTTCGEEVATRRVPGQHSNNGLGVCTVCDYATGNGGGAVADPNAKILKYSHFTTSDSTKDKTSISDKIADVADGYFTLTGEQTKESDSVWRRSSSTSKFAIDFIQLPKGGGAGIKFTVTEAPAKVIVKFGSTKSGETSKMEIKDFATGNAVAAVNGSTSTSNSGGLAGAASVEYSLPAGTYVVAATADSTYNVRLVQISVSENTSSSPAPHTHTWGDWTITTPATCGADGEQIRTCSGCGESQTGEIAATGRHTWGDWEIDIQNKTQTRQCFDCPAEQTEPLTLVEDYLDGATSDLHFTYSLSGTVTITDNIPAGHKVFVAYWNGSAFQGAKQATTGTATTPVSGSDEMKIIWIDGEDVPQSPAKAFEITESSSTGGGQTPTPDPDPTPDPTAQTHTFESNTLTKDTKPTSYAGDSYFTLKYGSKGKLDESNKEWKEETFGANAYDPAGDHAESKAVRFSMGAKSSANDGPGIAFTPAGNKVTVKIWWVQGGGDTEDKDSNNNKLGTYSDVGIRQIALLKVSDASEVVKSNLAHTSATPSGTDTGRIKANDPEYTEFTDVTVTPGTQYMIGSKDGSNYIFKVIVIDSAASTSGGGSTGGGSTGGSTGGGSTTPSTGSTITLDPSKLTETSKLESDLVDGIFTVIPASGKTLKIEAHNVTFPDFKATARINISGKLDTASKDKASGGPAVKFSTAGAAEVKVYWAPGADNKTDRHAVIATVDGTNFSHQTAEESASGKSSPLVSTFTVTKGDHYVGAAKDAIWIYRIEVTPKS